MSYTSHNSNSNSKPPIPAHFQAPLPIPSTQPKEYNPTYVAPSPLFMTGVPGTFGAGWDGNGPGSFNVNGGAQPHHQGGQQQPGFPSYETAKQIATLQSRLDRKLGPEYVSQRAGPGGSKLTYIEGWKVINVANEVFGFNGWSSTVQRLETDFCDTNPTTGRVAVGISAIIRITLRDGTVHEDVGYGEISNSPSKAAAFDKCKKEAITDAVKRALRSFGNVLGNCLYDKEYTKEINKMKTPTPRWDPKQLYRRPEFDEFGSRDGITTDPINGHNPQLAHAGPSSHASSSTSSATPAPPISRPTSYNTTPTTNTTNNNLARSAMNNSYNQNSASSSTSTNKVNGGGGNGRPINNNPPTPASLPRSNPAPPPIEATTLEECVPMGPTASQQMEMEFDDGFDLTGVVLDADAYSSGAGGGASSAGRRASGSEDVGDDSFAHTSAAGNASKSRNTMSAPPLPPPKQTTTPIANAPRSSKSSSPADVRSSTIGSSGNSNSNNNSNSSSSTSMKPPQQVPSASRPPPRVGGFNFPTGHSTTPSAAAATTTSNPPPPSEALKRNHSVAAAGNTNLATRVYPPNAGAAKRAQSLAGLTSLESASSFVPASVLPVVTRQPLGELPLFDDEGGDGGPAKRARVEYGGF